MAEQQLKTGKRPLLRLALGISLALNLAIIGAVAGTAYRFAGGPGGRDGRDMHSYGATYVRALPREARQGIREALKSQRSDLPSRSERRALYAELLEVLRAPDFDAETIKALFVMQQETALKVQSAAQQAWLKEVSAMSVADRNDFADRLEEMLKRKSEKRPKKPKQ